MDKTNNVLTLAFENAATAEQKFFHPWRYYVAGGATLAKIDEVIADYATVEQARVDLAKELGAKACNGVYGLEFDIDIKADEMLALTGKERVDFNLTGGSDAPWSGKRIVSFPDFIASEGRASGRFYPDVATPRGKQIRDAMKAIEDKAKPMASFARWLGAYSVDVPADPNYINGQRTNLSAKVVKIGNEWIVAVPVKAVPDAYPAKTYSEEWVTPPDSTLISVSEYFARAEKESLLTKTPKQ